MSAEQVLIDYIKKARLAGQSDEETRALLYKNGWTEDEVNEAMAIVDAEKKEEEVRASAQIPPREEEQKTPSADKDYQVSGKPEVKIREEREFSTISEKPISQQPPLETTPREGYATPQFSVSSSQSEEYQPVSQPAHPQYQKPRRKIGGLILKLFLIFFLLFLIIAIVYVAFFQPNILEKWLGVKSSPSTVAPESPLTNTPSQPSSTQETPSSIKPQETPINPKLFPKTFSLAADEYDITKIKGIGFDERVSKVIYCAPRKDNVYKISCFANDEKLFDSPYSFLPYWIGVSPDNQRTVFIFYDSIKRQSFIFENQKEGKRYNGTITWPQFSPDGKLFLYMVMANDGKNFVVLENVESEMYDKIYTPPQFSQDGGYIFYGAKQGQKIVWVVERTIDILRKQQTPPVQETPTGQSSLPSQEKGQSLSE